MSMINQTSLNVQTLFALVNEVHDYWFDIDMAKWEPECSKFHLFLGSNRKGPYVDKELVVGAVDSVVFCDDDKIGIYMLTDIVVNEASNEVVFEIAGLTIRIRVRSGWYIEIATIEKQGGASNKV